MIDLQKYYSYQKQYLDIFNEDKFVRTSAAGEDNLQPKMPYTSSSNPSTLVELRHHYEDCRNVDKQACEAKFPYLRYHYVDIRQQLYPLRGSYRLQTDKKNWSHHFKNSRAFDFIHAAVSAQVPSRNNQLDKQSTVSKFKKFTEILTKYNLNSDRNIKDTMEKFFKLYTNVSIDQTDQNIFNNFLYELYVLCFDLTSPEHEIQWTEEQFREKVYGDIAFMRYKINKQFREVDESIRDSLRDAIDKVLIPKATTNITRTNRPFKIPIIETGATNATFIGKNPILITFKILNWINIRLMDFYTLGRMFREYTAGPNDDYRNIIFHGGSYHSDTYSKIFKQLELIPSIEVGGDDPLKLNPSKGGTLLVERRTRPPRVISKHCIKLTSPFDYVNYEQTDIQVTPTSALDDE